MTKRQQASQAVAKPQGGARPAPQRREWAAPARFRAGDPQRYTRFVTVMKRALLLAALALILAVVIYSLQPREQDRLALTFGHLGEVANDLAMIKPRLSGSDAAGNPFVVTADAAIQEGPNAHRARLRNVQADVTLKTGGWLTASASDGLLDTDAKKLRLSGAIAVYSDSGYELHTASADVDLAKGAMRGGDAVTGQGPLGTLRADGFLVDHNKKQIRLIGHVKMTMFTRGTKHP